MRPVNPVLVWFAALAVIPVILHLLLRSQPKKLLFPALRLLQIRKKQTTQRLRLKHIGLLLLRMGIIIALAVALARPRIPPLNYWPTMWEWSSLAGILIVAAGFWWSRTSTWKRNRLPEFQYYHQRMWLSVWVTSAAVGLIGLLVLWPLGRRVLAEMNEPSGPVGENVPVACVMIFDSSLSMQYRQAGQTRLEVARDMALDYVRRLPDGSRVAIVDTASTSPVSFFPDLATGINRLSGLDVKARSVTLSDRLRAALETQQLDQQRILQTDADLPEDQRQDTFVREIFVFSDLTPGAWPTAASPLLKDDLAKNKSVNLYLIDVSIPQPQNAGISELRLSDTTVPQGTELRLQVQLTTVGQVPASLPVEVHVQSEAGPLVKQDQAILDVKAGEASTVELLVKGLTGPVKQGEVRLVTSDPLPFDDVHYFTVEVQPAPEVLLVASDPNDVLFWQQALSPAAFVKRGKARYQCSQLAPGKLATANLRNFAAVCLVNVLKLEEASWKVLEQYVREGGGVFVAVGEEVDPISYNSPIAGTFLPGELRAHLKFIPPEYFDVQTLEHPLMKRFNDWGVSQLNSVPIERYWRVKPSQEAAVIAPFSDVRQSPALLERVHGKGRTVLFTTGVSRKGWNELPTVWSFAAFADQTMRYLSRQSQGTFNYLCGEEVSVRLDPEQPLSRYLLRKPNRQQLPGDVPAGQTSLRIRDADQLGQYRVLGVEADSRFDRGFSVNAPPLENLLSPVSQAQLNEYLGEKRYSLAKNLQQLEKKGLGGQRIGVEIFPMLIFLLWLVFLGEHLLANRFHQGEVPAAVASKG